MLLAVLNLIGYVGTIIVNGLANALPINNKTTGELSDLYPNLFVPAALTFSIWGVIYILLGIFVVYGMVSAIRKSPTGSYIDKIGILFFLTCMANAGWIFAWHFQVLWLSMIMMLVILGALITIYLRLSTGLSDANPRVRLMVHLPFSVYLGWITVATIANLTALLVDIKWNTFGLGEQFWTVAVIAVAIVITLIILLQRRDIFYSLVVDWALLGILVKRLSIDTVPDQAVVIAAITGVAVVTVGIIYQGVRRKIYLYWV